MSYDNWKLSYPDHYDQDIVIDYEHVLEEIDTEKVNWLLFDNEFYLNNWEQGREFEDAIIEYLDKQNVNNTQEAIELLNKISEE